MLLLHPWRLIAIISLILMFLVAGLFGFIYLRLPDVSVLKSHNPPTTAIIEQRKNEARLAQRSYRVYQRWVAFARIPKLLKDAVRISEDAGFYWHNGVDYGELKAAIIKDLKARRFARGASTITQQVAKNLYLSTEKSLWRKLKEYFIARRLENKLTKDRIFHIYLNIVEFGPGIFGVQAASQYYFRKDVSQLKLEEMVRLAAVLPRPLKVKPTGHSPWLKWKVDWILTKLKQYRYIDQIPRLSF